MTRFRLFPRDHKPSLGELLGSSQADRQVSRKHTIRIVRHPLAPPTPAEPWAPRHAAGGGEPSKLARLLGRLLG
jgi:hypothetical protein